MSKMGRPRSDVIKDKIVTIRMSDEEHIKLRDYSQKHQQTITETIKKGVDLLYQVQKQDVTDNTGSEPVADEEDENGIE